MKSQFFRIMIALVCLASLAASNFTALAQQEPSDRPEAGAAESAGQPLRRPFVQGAQAVSSESPAVSLGQPGFSLRYVKTFGVTEEPYVADVQHLNAPNGMAVDSGDNLYVIEELGSRMLKFDSSGTNQMTIGYAGQPWHHDDYLANPLDVMVDGDGNIWFVIPSAVKKFDAAGNLLMIFPEEDPWHADNDNNHFDTPRGIALGPAGQLFVSDTYNHRIQVFDVSGDTISYSETIGVTGDPRSDNSGFDQPAQIAFDSSGRLYVVDTGNYRVQRCTKSGTWTCSAFYGTPGEWGDDLAHLGWAFGITITGADNIFIADGDNYRVLKCNTSGTCSHFAGTTGSPGWSNSQFAWPADAAVDSSGNVFVSDWSNHRVQKFNSAGVYQSTLGVTRVPYIVDTERLNAPWGVTVATDGSIYLTERSGYRLVKLNKDGVQQWAVGQAGVYGNDNSHFGDSWAGPEGNPAVDSGGKVYVPDAPNHRIQIYNTNGVYQSSFGNYGDGNYEFDFPAGVAISPVNGDIYILDHANQRVQIYTSSLVYKASLGALDSPGAGNYQFRWPRGLTVDKNGNIYVADTDNQRVQMYNSSRVYQRTFGVSEECGGDFGHLCTPLSVAVDQAGRVYVADANSDRVQVFEANGAYLTTIGNDWGANTGQMRWPTGLAIDAKGDLYVAETNNHRVQKFSLGTPYWGQVNINGFGERENQIVTTLQTYGGLLYAATYNYSGNGGQLWRHTGSGWSVVMSNGFGDATNMAIDHLYEFNGNLYAGTWNEDSSAPNSTTGGQMWRSSNGTNWSRISLPGLDASNGEIFRFTQFNGQLYASTWTYTSDHGGEIWRSPSGDSGTWSQVAANGFDGNVNNIGATAFEVYNNQLYAGTYNYVTGGEVWRSPSGNAGSWTQVNLDGFGEENSGINSLVAFQGYLYAGVMNGAISGAKLWRCQVCDGSDWEKIMDGGFGNPNTRGYHALAVMDGWLYSLIRNNMTGMVVYRSLDGLTWEQVGFSGFGDSNNRGGYWGNSVVVHRGALFAGTTNGASGGEVWVYANKLVLLPVLRK